MATDGFLIFENVTKRFGAHAAVDGVSVGVQKGEVFSLLGPSGCGKTTLLRIAAGLETPDEGRVWLDGEDITDLPPERRRVNTVFQNYALFPHLTVAENIAFGPRAAGWPRARIREEVDRMLALVQLTDQAGKKPRMLSGGQKQRVAIARALINQPRVLLLDEPLAALDLKLRQRMLVELDLIHDEVGITFVYVTHDQGEAMGLSDRIAVMNRGRIEQIGRPAEIYEAPRTGFVAAFIGDTNFLEGRVEEHLGDNYCRLGVEGFPDIECFNDTGRPPGEPVCLSVRPEKIRISRERPEPAPHVNVVPARVADAIYLGTHTRFWVRVGRHRVAVWQPHARFLLDERPIRWGDEVWISWHGDDGFMLERFSGADAALVATPPERIGAANGGVAP